MKEKPIMKPLPALLPHLGRRGGWLFVLIQVIHGSCLELQGVDHDIGFGSKVI